MIAHIYASYKCSPVGFNLGSITYQEGKTDNYYLSYRGESELIYRVFEQGFISSAEGRLPNSTRWLLLVKDLAYTYSEHPEFGKTVDINIAFEFDNVDEYVRFASGYKSFSNDTISEKMASFIIPDKNDKEYALHIDAVSFNSFVKEMCSRKSEADIFTDCFVLVTRANDKSGFDDKILKLFGISFSRELNRYFYPPKKKHSLKNRTLMNNHKTSSQKSKQESKQFCALIQKYKPVVIVAGGLLGLGLLTLGIRGLIFLFFKR